MPRPIVLVSISTMTEPENRADHPALRKARSVLSMFAGHVERRLRARLENAASLATGTDRSIRRMNMQT
jgi:hypothetical protein